MGNVGLWLSIAALTIGTGNLIYLFARRRDDEAFSDVVRATVAAIALAFTHAGRDSGLIPDSTGLQAVESLLVVAFVASVVVAVHRQQRRTQDRAPTKS